ncbi:30S ribosomal protein S9 [Candidatus Woesearchaeota archaeon]|nr:30S ribosomal protein S9 [Candidatus Woesearchaeota archaeon]
MVIQTSGKRKRAVARATLSSGNGIVKINKILLDNIRPEIARDKIKEPLLLAGDLVYGIDLDISTAGGGMIGQAEAARLAIARSLLLYSKSAELKQTFLEYDRSLLVADVRRKETRKPNDSKARAKRQKSYR